MFYSAYYYYYYLLLFSLTIYSYNIHTYTHTDTHTKEQNSHLTIIIIGTSFIHLLLGKVHVCLLSFFYSTLFTLPTSDLVSGYVKHVAHCRRRHRH